MTSETQTQEELEEFYSQENYYGPDSFDPTESENTNLSTVPTSATISFRSGNTRDTQMSFIIHRAMIDPEAEVIPYEEADVDN